MTHFSFHFNDYATLHDFQFVFLKGNSCSALIWLQYSSLNRFLAMSLFLCLFFQYKCNAICRICPRHFRNATIFFWFVCWMTHKKVHTLFSVNRIYNNCPLKYSVMLKQFTNSNWMQVKKIEIEKLMAKIQNNLISRSMRTSKQYVLSRTPINLTNKQVNGKIIEIIFNCSRRKYQTIFESIFFLF